MVLAKRVSAIMAPEIIFTLADTIDESSTDDYENEFFFKKFASSEENYSTIDGNNFRSTSDFSRNRMRKLLNLKPAEKK
jgi:hypothetical protein